MEATKEKKKSTAGPRGSPPSRHFPFASSMDDVVCFKTKLRTRMCLLGLAVVVLIATFVFQRSPPRAMDCLSLPEVEGIGDGSEDQIQNLVEGFVRRLVAVTAISDNHFDESQPMLSSVERCLPNNKIILYDLGLKDENKRRIGELYKNVQILPFPFSDYENHSHVRDLLTYAWKPIIIKKVSLEYDIIMYGDASMRMTESCDIKQALSHLLYFPFFAAVRYYHKAIEFTHDGMIEYLHFPKARKDLADMYSIEATGFLMWANTIMKELLIEPWLDCALHRECIAPLGATLRPCHMTQNHDGHYIGCHRYDQSALDIILAREFGPHSTQRAKNEEMRKSIWYFQKT